MRRTSVLTVIAFCLLGLFISGSAHAKGGSLSKVANLVLGLPSSSIHQTSSGWTLEKTGTLDPDSNTVTWVIALDPSANPSSQLVVKGWFAVWNLGTAPATIGNVVVNLQHKPLNTWITVSTNIADATSGDGATTALIVEGNTV